MTPRFKTDLKRLAHAGAGLLAFSFSAGLAYSDFELPEIVDPGPPVSVAPPSDAIVLFDGSDLSQWRTGDGGAAQWEVNDGVATVNGTGNIISRESFGDMQLYLEWETPEEVTDQRGNSGVYLQSRYEIQILDSYDNRPYYADGRRLEPAQEAGGLYKQYAPLVNASRAPGEWQSFNIIFTAPRFDSDGDLLKPAYVTVFHNGILILNHVEVHGNTEHSAELAYHAHPLEQPILLQDHGDAVRFRNIWVRPL